MSWPTGINLDRLEPDSRGNPDSDIVEAVDASGAALETEIIVESLSNGWSAQAGNTAHVLARLGNHTGFEPPTGDDPETPYGRYLGRPIIGRDSRIDGGVYIGRKPREAIVVDMAQPGLLYNVYSNWLIELQKQAPMWPWQHITSGRKRAVQRYLDLHMATLCRALVSRVLPFDRHVVAQVAEEHTLGPDDKVRLDVYLRRRGGVCRHQVCLLGGRCSNASWTKAGRKATSRSTASLCRASTATRGCAGWMAKGKCGFSTPRRMSGARWKRLSQNAGGSTPAMTNNSRTP